MKHKSTYLVFFLLVLLSAVVCPRCVLAEDSARAYEIVNFEMARVKWEQSRKAQELLLAQEKKRVEELKEVLRRRLEDIQGEKREQWKEFILEKQIRQDGMVKKLEDQIRELKRIEKESGARLAQSAKEQEQLKRQIQKAVDESKKQVSVKKDLDQWKSKYQQLQKSFQEQEREKANIQNRFNAELAKAGQANKTQENNREIVLLENEMKRTREAFELGKKQWAAERETLLKKVQSGASAEAERAKAQKQNQELTELKKQFLELQKRSENEKAKLEGENRKMTLSMESAEKTQSAKMENLLKRKDLELQGKIKEAEALRTDLLRQKQEAEKKLAEDQARSTVDGNKNSAGESLPVSDENKMIEKVKALSEMQKELERGAEALHYDREEFDRDRERLDERINEIILKEKQLMDLGIKGDRGAGQPYDSLALKASEKNVDALKKQIEILTQEKNRQAMEMGRYQEEIRLGNDKKLADDKLLEEKNKEIESLKQQVKTLAGTGLENKDAQMKQLSEQLVRMKATSEASRKESDKVRGDLEKSVLETQSQIKSKDKEIEALLKTGREKDTQIKQLKKMTEELEGQVKRLEKNLTEKTSQNKAADNLKKQIAETDRELKASRKKIEELNNRMKGNTEDFEARVKKETEKALAVSGKELRAKEKVVLNKRDELENLTRKLAQKEKDFQERENKVKQNEQMLAERQKSLEQKGAASESADVLISDLEKQVRDLKDDLKNRTAELMASLKETKALSAQVNQARIEGSEQKPMDERIAALRQQFENEKKQLRLQWEEKLNQEKLSVENQKAVWVQKNDGWQKKEADLNSWEKKLELLKDEQSRVGNELKEKESLLTQKKEELDRRYQEIEKQKNELTNAEATVSARKQHLEDASASFSAKEKEIEAGHIQVKEKLASLEERGKILDARDAQLEQKAEQLNEMEKQFFKLSGNAESKAASGRKIPALMERAEVRSDSGDLEKLRNELKQVENELRSRDEASRRQEEELKAKFSILENDKLILQQKIESAKAKEGLFEQTKKQWDAERLRIEAKLKEAESELKKKIESVQAAAKKSAEQDSSVGGRQSGGSDKDSEAAWKSIREKELLLEQKAAVLNERENTIRDDEIDLERMRREIESQKRGVEAKSTLVSQRLGSFDEQKSDLLAQLDKFEKEKTDWESKRAEAANALAKQLEDLKRQKELFKFKRDQFDKELKMWQSDDSKSKKIAMSYDVSE